MKNNNKLNDYFNPAKNSRAEFTQNELQQIVESRSDENESGFNFTSTNNWKRTLIMFTQTLTFLTCIIGIIFGIGTYPNSTSPSKQIQTTNNPEKKNFLNSEANLSSTKLTAETPQNSNVRATEQNKKEDIKRLNIEGITTISLTNEELAKLEIYVEKDCGITLFNRVLTGTFYNYNKNSSNNESKDLKSDEAVKESSHSVWKMTTSEHDAHKNNNFPMIITSTHGTILSYSIGDNLDNQTNADINVAKEEFDDSRKKPTITLFKYPNDSTTEEQIQKTIADTSKFYTIYKRLTTEDVVQMKKETDDRTERINEYLKLNKLIAIKVNANCPNNTVIFWFEPTADFINQLPERYRTSMLHEIVRNSKTKNTSLKEETAILEQKPQTGCQYSDICRATSGAVSETSVFPNPANESLNLKFILNEQRKCTFSLHDLNGIYIQQLSREMTFLKGEHTTTMDIHDVKAGVYLLSMTTDQNERIVQRVIVKK